MATPVQNAPKPAPKPGPAPVIREDPLARRDNWREWLLIIIAFLISGGLHALLFVLTVNVFGIDLEKKQDPAEKAKEKIAADEQKAIEEEERQAEVVNTKVEEAMEEPTLTNPEEGLDPEIPTQYDVNRIDEVSVPGQVDPNAAVGIVGAPEGPPVTIPPPPGSGGGQGGAPIGPEFGTGVMDRTQIGGIGGIRNVPGGFGGRSAATRERMATEGGGSAASEASVGKGLRWLALHQAPEGYWSLDNYHKYTRRDMNSNVFIEDKQITGKGQNNDVAGAAFGVLPYLAAGITHKASGKAQDDQYVKTVTRALNYLMSKQNAKDGSFSGNMYTHGLATIAMCEAYGLTADPSLKKHAQAALNFIVYAQDPNGGGWRYGPRQGGDTSVVGWQVMALKSGQMSGLTVPPTTLKLAEKWLDSCETTDGGGYGYTGPQETYTLSAVGLLCRQYLGTPRRNANLANGVKKLTATLPAGTNNIYYEYYATQVFHHMGGDYWDLWNKGKDGKSGMRDTLIKRQDADGSWDPRRDVFGSHGGGRIMQTSLSLLTLEVYYRHLPLYQRVDTKK